LGGYLFFERGTISIKGKGEPLRTYWLIGESDQRKSHRKSISNSEQARNSITEILFSQKSKSSHTPEMRSTQVCIDMFRCSTPRIRCGACGEHNKKSSKPLFPISEKNSPKEKSELSQLSEFRDSTQLHPSRSQYSLNLFSSSKNKKCSLLPTSQSITINETPISKDIDPPPYKSLNLSQSAYIKSSNQMSGKEFSIDIQKSSSSLNGLFSRKAISLPQSMMQRKLLRTESLPQLKSTQTNTVSIIHEIT